MNTLVTGATGFIGYNLVKRLAQDGHRLRCLTRTDGQVRELEALGATTIMGDITDKESLLEAMDGCDRVFHLAAWAKNWAPDPTAYISVNVEGFCNVAEAALHCGVGKMVFTSSSVVSGPTDEDIAGEDLPRRDGDFLTEYEKSKYLAEKRAAELLDQGLPLVIVRPTRVYGPGKLTEGNSVTLLVSKLMRGRFPFVLGDGLQVGNYVYVEDVVEGHIRAMADGKVGEAYILGGENSTLRNLFALVGEAAGRKPPRLKISPALARTFAKAEELKADTLGIYPLVTTGWIETFLHNWAYTSEKAKADLGYSSRGLDEGIRLTCDWLRSREESS